MITVVTIADVIAIDDNHDYIDHFFESVITSTQVSVAQAKAEFAALVLGAEAGEEIVVTRNGKPVARITPLILNEVACSDLTGLRLSDDLSLPDDIIADFMAR